jgi:hypothetical protein
MNFALVKSVIFATACAFAAAAGAQQYKWVDKDGKVRYGDVPPPGVKATPLRAPSGPATPAPSGKDAKGAKGPATPAEQEAGFRKRQQEQQVAEEKAAKERADAEAKRANCEQAQQTLRSFQSGERIAVVNQAGERVYLEDAERARQAERAQQSVREWCQ